MRTFFEDVLAIRGRAIRMRLVVAGRDFQCALSIAFDGAGLHEDTQHRFAISLAECGTAFNGLPAPPGFASRVDHESRAYASGPTGGR